VEREAFLARLRRARPGPELPDVRVLPHAQTEARGGEDLLDRFREELTAVAGLCEIVTRGHEGVAVGASLQSAGARRVALGSDLGRFADPVRAGLEALGIGAVAYDDVVADRAALGALDATVTGCDRLVAATGSIVTSARAGRAAALIAPIHVCVAGVDQLVGGLSDVLAALPDASLVALQSGPSRTADIEKRLILGMHGPGTTLVLIVRDAPSPA